VTVAVRVEVEEGVPVVRHLADREDADHLRRTGERLALAADPGVVPLLASRSDGDGWELVTAYAGPPLAASSVGTPERLAAVGATVAATLARLHDRGLVHGRLERVHVLIGSDGAPVLSGIGADDAGAGAADDVAALGRVLMDLADELALGPRGAERGALARLDAALASTGGPEEGRPSARRLAAELDALAGAPAGAATRRRPRSVVVRVLALVTGLAFGAFIVSQAWTSGTTTRPRSAAVTSTVPRSVPVVVPCAATAGHRVDRSTCGFDAVVDGGVVEIDGVRSVVGRDDDVVAVGDWDCDGHAEPALVRPETGEVLVFGPADATGARPVVRATRVAGAWRFDVGEGEPGCAALRVADRTGRVVPIEGRSRSISS
jgi:hypothetical protein